ncbi:L domain-like protein [Gonapodya prolifera JEL478]|uniref:L domain-like protein n=1 Tax=Gonapodya prolifera (strain JEL478) TaxID=1344416 RepID=A0A139A6T9_GONPJ|nr:L domain-like protein [Gonapodya prolifera JEL478]|eukprot:KXS12532.1 L domain-like protein [Gonapodya prolifera JEL478]
MRPTILLFLAILVPLAWAQSYYVCPDLFLALSDPTQSAVGLASCCSSAPVDVRPNSYLFCNGPNVTAVHLNGTSASTLEHFRGLTDLLELTLVNASLTGALPPWLNELGALRTLSLRTNRLTGNAEIVASLTNLLYLDLAENQLSGSLSWLRQNTLLQQADLHSNTFVSSSTTSC